jgi:hypothetical protein
MKSLVISMILLGCSGLMLAATSDPTPRFIRGDANSDEKVDLGDAIAVLFNLFAGEPVRCLATADANGDSALNVVDPVYLLGYLFADTAPPPAPFPACAAPIEEAVLGCNDPVCPAAIEDGCSIAIHGTAVRGVECIVFQTDEKKTYQLIGGPPDVNVIGWTGTVTARGRPDLASFCMQGSIVEVCTAEADPLAPAGGSQ